jgi:phosphatidylglycerophosphate synthase
MDRRPLQTRQHSWARRLAAGLVKFGLTPNSVSMIGILFAAAAGGLLWDYGEQPWALLLAAACVQLRLLCNMLDGLMAVEFQAGSATGCLFNEAPDRLEDALILVGAGYATGYPWLGWLAALLAANTAYVRVFGGSVGLKQDFSGWGSKPRRMFWVTLTCLSAAICQGFELRSARELMFWGIAWTTALTAGTLCGRLLRVYNRLKAKPLEGKTGQDS